MVEIRWTLQSLEDIENIAQFISRESERFARIQVERFFQAEEIISEHPKAGRIVPEIGNNGVREIILGNYRLIYYIINDIRIDVLTIHHSKRELKNNPAIKKIK